MAAVYDPTGHPLLSPAAVALAPLTLEQWAELATDLFGLPVDPVLTDRAYDKAVRAIAMQVSFMLEGGVDAGVYEEVRRKDRTWKYRSGLFDPRAAAIVDDVLTEAGAWGRGVQSFRGPNDWPNGA